MSLKQWRNLVILPFMIAGLAAIHTSAQSGTEEQSSQGWHHAPWLGHYYVLSEFPGWMAREGLGWLFAYSDPADDAVWFYGEGFGYLWTSSHWFPWLYLEETKEWVYYHPQTADPAFFYFLNSETWQVDPTRMLTARTRSEMTFTPFSEAPFFSTIGNLIRVSPFLEYRELKYTMNGGIQVRGLPLQKEANIRRGELVQIRTAMNAGAFNSLVGSPAFLNITTEHATYNVGVTADKDTLDVRRWNGDFRYLYPQTQTVSVFADGTPLGLVDAYHGSFLNPGNYKLRVGLLNDGRIYTPFDMLNLTVNRQDPPQLRGNIVADSGFRPNPHGFGFPNFGDIEPNDLPDEAIHYLLGPSASWTDPDGNLVLKATSRFISRPILDGMTGGHCFGMALAATRLFEAARHDANVPLTLENIDPTAKDVIELQKFQVRQPISVDMAMQFTSPFILNDIVATGAQGPTQVLQDIIEIFNRDETVPLLAMLDREATMGHAVTPYAISDAGEGVFQIHCWDNNFPDNYTLAAIVDTTTDTWTFESTNPQIGVPYPGFEGDALSGNLSYLDWEMVNDYQPGFVPGYMYISSTAGTHLLVENVHGEQVGYDFETGTFVDTYPDARIIPIFEVDKEPRYLVPIPEGSEHLPPDFDVEALFSQLIGVEVGLPIDSETDSTALTLSFQSDTFVKTVKGITAVEGETFVIFTHPSGRIFAADGEDVDIERIVFEFAINDDANERGYIFKIDNFNIPDTSGIMVIIDDDFNPLVLNLAAGDAVILTPDRYTVTRTMVGVSVD